ncbi:MAG: alpha/beta hydrolase [Intrasporangium sp.]|uniref:alpha/beta fold hydrolase n=1 Tax=Intrasporangium sp. TaxID=1925024 RepID=UPI0026488E60|nr:alpha/beta fold hydrolase [Intrasporangium sp.]MDN5796212.1 alpha/beta hydrolase [Intrasporangium sp.]
MPPTVALTELRPASPGADLLVVGPSLGTAVAPLWSACATDLPGEVCVIGWDLPGHGRSRAGVEPFTVAGLAESVLAATELVRNQAPGRVWYAGVSLGGAVGLQLAVEHGEAFDGIAVLCAGAKIGEATDWHERADLVRRMSTSVMISGSAQRWFAPGFLDRDPRLGTNLLNSLQDTDQESYARCCEALADFDLTSRLGEAGVPVLALAGAADEVTPMASAEQIARGTGGRAVLLDDAAHLAPAEQPSAVAAILADFFRIEVSHATA